MQINKTTVTAHGRIVDGPEITVCNAIDGTATIATRDIEVEYTNPRGRWNIARITVSGTKTNGSGRYVRAVWHGLGTGANTLTTAPRWAQGWALANKPADDEVGEASWPTEVTP
jgi:hypothetical protein